MLSNEKYKKKNMKKKIEKSENIKELFKYSDTYYNINIP